MAAQRLLDVDLLLLWFFSLLAGITTAFWPEIPQRGTLLSLYLSAALLAALLPWTNRAWGPPKALLLRAVLLCILITAAFSSLGFLIHHVSPDDRHWQLLIWDRRIFGGDPVRDAHDLGHPVLTDILQLAYASYYFLPLALGIALFREKRFRELENALALVALAFFLSYLGYFLVPARSPNEILPGLWQEGWIVAEPLARWTREAELLKRDAFPSGHLEVTLVVLVFAWRCARRAFWWLLFPSLGLTVATVYLGYHYAIDLVGGAALALVVAIAAKRTGLLDPSLGQGEREEA